MRRKLEIAEKTIERSHAALNMRKDNKKRKDFREKTQSFHLDEVSEKSRCICKNG